MSFQDVLREMNHLYLQKQADYGDSFHETHVNLGEVAGLTRIMDKTNRLVSLQNKPENFESKRDTYIDLANYAAMMVNELDGGKGAEKQYICSSGEVYKVIENGVSREPTDEDILEYHGMLSADDDISDNTSLKYQLEKYHEFMRTIYDYRVAVMEEPENTEDFNKMFIKEMLRIYASPFSSETLDEQEDVEDDMERDKE